MITSFDLPVGDGQTVRAIYQMPEAATQESHKPAFQKVRTARFAEAFGLDPAAPPTRKPLIVMLHGFPGGHKSGCDDLFGELEYRFEGMGYPSIRFDFRGCGESSGTEEDFSIASARADLSAVLQWAQHDAGHRHFVLLGESCGATVAILGFDPKIIEGMILLWPAITLRETDLREILHQDIRPEKSKKGVLYRLFHGRKLGMPFVEEIETLDLTDALKAITIPAILQHGAADEEVPLEQAYFARDNMPGLVDLAIFEGGGHGLRAANMREHLYVNISHYLTRVFKKLDSGAKT